MSFEPTPWTPSKDTAPRALAETLATAVALLTVADAVAARCGQAGAVRAIAAELQALAGKLDPNLQPVELVRPERGT